MKSEWRVERLPIGWKNGPFYCVFRKIDAEARIEIKSAFADKAAAQAFADDLNAKDREASK